MARSTLRTLEFAAYRDSRPCSPATGIGHLRRLGLAEHYSLSYVGTAARLAAPSWDDRSSRTQLPHIRHGARQARDLFLQPGYRQWGGRMGRKDLLSPSLFLCPHAGQEGSRLDLILLQTRRCRL